MTQSINLSHEQKHLTHPKYRADIDGLRAVAVLSVVGFHAFPDWVKGGYVGVDIFFVISGFLISSIIFGSLAKDAFSFREFYARRIKRIFPALIVVLTFCIAFGWYTLFPNEYVQLSKHVVASGAFLSNFAFWREAGYFNNGADTKPLLHLWSLGIEEQFYIVWPLMLYFAWKRKVNLLWMAVILAIISFILNIAFIGPKPIATFYLPITRFWELLFGSILGYITLNGMSLWNLLSNWNLNNNSIKADSDTTSWQESPILRNAQAAIGSLLIAAAISLINKFSAFPGWLALLPTLGTCLIISAGPRAWLNRFVLSHRVIVWFGLISYPLYLWHWPLLSFARIIESGTTTYATRITAVLTAILLAWITFQCLEKKIRFRKEGIVTITLLFLCSTVIFVGVLAKQETIHPRHFANKNLDKVFAAFGDWDYPPKGFGTIKYENMKFFMKRGDGEKVLFLGDSNVEQYASRVDELLSESSRKNKSAIFATKSGCPPIPNVLEATHEGCQAMLATATKLALSPDIDTVVIGACWWCYLVEQTKPGSEYDFYFEKDGHKEYFKGGKGVAESLNALSGFLKLLSAQKKVFLILNTPAGPSLDPSNLVGGSRLGQLFFKPRSILMLSEY